MFARLALIAAPLFLGACATTPLEPDPWINPLGRWAIVAVSGQRTPPGRSFRFEITATDARAQFGCNDGGGAARVERGWLIPSSDWIMTVASCVPKDLLRFERRGFAITAKPMAIERRKAGGIRLRNEAGSIDLMRRS
jgi:hypothetical protein